MRFFVYEYACCQLPDRSADAEALRAEGHAMLTAVCADLAALPGAAVETMEPPDDEADFRRRAAAADFTLVIAPELDGLLLDRCRWVEEAGGRLLGSSSAAVRLAGDKLLLADHLCARGVPTPPVWPLRDALRGGGAPFPVVVKRRDGAGSLGTFLAGDRHSLEHGARSLDVDRFLVQPLVPGTAASVALLIGPRQTLTLAPALQHLSQDGRFQYQGGDAPLPEPLAGRAGPSRWHGGLWREWTGWPAMWGWTWCSVRTRPATGCWRLILV